MRKSEPRRVRDDEVALAFELSSAAPEGESAARGGGHTRQGKGSEDTRPMARHRNHRLPCSRGGALPAEIRLPDWGANSASQTTGVEENGASTYPKSRAEA